MSDLKVDYTQLEGTHRALGYLAGEFGGLQASNRGYDATLGSGTVASAMDGFADNWNYHRDQLVANMKKLDDMITESVRAFLETDEQAARELRGPGGK